MPRCSKRRIAASGALGAAPAAPPPPSRSRWRRWCRGGAGAGAACSRWCRSCRACRRLKVRLKGPQAAEWSRARAADSAALLATCPAQVLNPHTFPTTTTCPAERTRTPASEGGPIDEFAVAQGRNMSLPGAKTEVRRQPPSCPPACLPSQKRAAADACLRWPAAAEPAAEPAALPSLSHPPRPALPLPARGLQTVSSRLWSLDRLDQRELPLDAKFTYGSGRGVL